MAHSLKQAADTILDYSVNRAGGVPGVVAMATNRHENTYEGATGKRAMDKPAPMTLDSVMVIFSTTKAITGTAIMQLIEEGKIALTDPAKKYAPAIGELQVLTGFDAAGKPITRAPSRDILVNDLMLHTSGLCYEFFSADELRCREAMGIPSIISGEFAALKSVLLHDPGARWTYGPNIDWLGLIVEQQRGKSLGEVFKERIFDPLDMHDIDFVLNPSMRARLAVLHQRMPDGQLVPQPDLILPQPPTMPMAMGGHGLYGSIGDYMKFVRMFLNDGAGPLGRVLKAETVARMAQDGLGSLSSGGWTTSIPALANAGEFFPGLDKGWAYTFMTNREDAPTGRPAGSLSWAGLSNLFYWIDRKHGLGGFWGSQVLPFQDIASYTGFVDFETAVYRHMK